MSLSTPAPSLQVARPGEVRLLLGQWLRLCRQRQELTLPMLASRSGVPVTTLSRLEREGRGGVESGLLVLQALGLLDGVHGALLESMRLVSLPRDLGDLDRPVKVRQRVRRRTQAGPPP